MGTSAKYNKRSIKFLDVQGSEKGEYFDPWDQQFKVILDLDYNGEIVPASGALDGVILRGDDKDRVYYSVVVWSVGDDGKSDSTPKNDKNRDNVYSFTTNWNKAVGHVISK